MGRLEQPAVGMIVDVDEAGGNNSAGGIDNLARVGGVEIAEGSDPVPVDADVGATTRGPGAVDDFTVANYDVKHEWVLLGVVPKNSGACQIARGRAGLGVKVQLLP